MKFEPYTLDVRAREYIRTCLSEGLTLARLILATSNKRAGGKVTTLLPSNTDPAILYDFYSGGKVPMADESQWVRIPGGLAIPLTDTAFHPAAAYKKFLNKDPYHIGICENALAGANDRWILKSDLRIYTFNDEVYGVLLPEDNQIETISSTVRHHRSVTLSVGIMTSTPQNDPALQGTRGIFNLDQLTYFADHVEKLVIGAYDGEAFLIWELNSS